MKRFQRMMRFTLLACTAVFAMAAHGQTGISGKVASAAGATPLEWVSVECYVKRVDEFSGDISWSGPLFRATDANGEYSFDLPTGTYRLFFKGYVNNYSFSVWYDDGVDLESAKDVSVAAGSITLISPLMDTGSSISGAVLDSDGITPLPDTHVQAWRWDPERAFWYNAGMDITDAQGNYVVAGLDSGTYRVYFENFTSITFEYYDNAVDIDTAKDIVLASDVAVRNINAALGGDQSRGGRILGTVVGPDGITPLSNIYVEAWTWDEPTASWGVARTAFTDANGKYLLWALIPGTYRILFSDDSHKYPSEYYGNAVDISNATNVVMAGNYSVMTAIDAALGDAPSSVATLKALALSAGTLNPVFESGTKAYSITVSNGVATTTITPRLDNASASVRVNGTAVQSGAASASIPLAVGENTINVVVTAEDGNTKRTYTVTVTRKPSSNALLKKFEIKGAKLNPTFEAKQFAYKTRVPSTQKSLQIQVRTANSASKINIAGQKVKSGEMSPPIPLNSIGKTSIKVVVSAQDGSKRTYFLTVLK